MDPKTAAFDTSVLCRPFDRRFIMSTWQGLGCKVAVLPRVAQELYGTMADNEADHWHSVLNGEEKRSGIKYSPVTRYDIVDAASKGVQKWIGDEIDAQQRDGFERQSALELVSMSREEKAEASRLAALIPSYCFRGYSANGHAGDRQVIAEAVVMKFHVLASKNRNSIRRVQTNSWLRQSAGVNVDLVEEADDVVSGLLLTQGPKLGAPALDAVLHACLPLREASPQREHSIVKRFLDTLQAGSFPDCGSSALDLWLSAEGPEMAEKARASLAPSLARETEDRRVRAVRAAASEVGWSPSP